MMSKKRVNGGGPPPPSPSSTSSSSGNSSTNSSSAMSPAAAGTSSVAAAALATAVAANSSNNPSSATTQSIFQTLISRPSSLPAFSWLAHVKMEHLLAGISGGVASTVVLHPLDLLKVRLAVNDGQVTTRPQYEGMTSALRTIWREEGVRGLYRGVIPNCWGAGTSWGVYFLFYNTIKARMLENRGIPVLGPTAHMLAAAEAGVFTLILTNPIWVVKTRLCLQYGNIDELNLPAHKRYSGMIDCFRKVIRHEGWLGLYKGFVPGMLGVSHGALQFMAYEELKRVYLEKYPEKTEASLGTGEYLTFAAISKLFAAGMTYPYQVVRARLQDQHKDYGGLVDVVVKTYRYRGFFGFYAGLSANLLRVVPATGITFVVYEHTSKALKGYRREYEASHQSDSGSITKQE